MNKQYETVNKLIADAEAIFSKAKEDGRELTADESKATDEMFTRVKAIKETIAKEKTLAGEEFAKITEAKPSKAEAASAVNVDESGKAREAFNTYLRTGDKQNFVITTGTGSGAILPKAVDVPYIVRRNYNSILAAIASRGYSVIETDTAETWAIPVMDDSANAGQVMAEDASTDTALDPTVTSLSLGASLYDSKTVWLSNTQVSAVGYDLAAYLMPIMEKRVELIKDSTWITKLLTHQKVGNTVVGSTTSGITYAEFVSVYHKLPVQYRTDGVFLMSDGLVQAIRGLLDDSKRPLINFIDPLNVGAIGMLQGCPVFVSNYLDAPAANKVTGAFVSAEALKVRSVKNRRIARYENIPTFPDQVGFRLFENGDFDAVEAACAFFKQAAS